MEAALFRWSTVVQLSSLILIATFFVALARSTPAINLRWWIASWSCNVLALFISVSYWFVQPQDFVSMTLMRGLYMGGKTAFVVCLIVGAWSLKNPGKSAPARPFAAGLIAYGLLAAILVDGIEQIGVVQQGLLGIGCVVGIWVTARGVSHSGMSWLLLGFVLRAILSFTESATYAVPLFPAGTFSDSLYSSAGFFSSTHSTFDSGTEWLMALGCVLALNHRTHRRLEDFNGALLEAQAELRQIADRDPLTALANRRALPAALRTMQPKGASLLFLDLDDFKGINDRFGHAVGDACLVRFARALEDCFRPDDTVVRYAGDEFLVVAGGLDRVSVERRVSQLRERLSRPHEETPAIHFSAGVGELAPGGQPDAALQDADRAMYAAKERKTA